MLYVIDIKSELYSISRTIVMDVGINCIYYSYVLIAMEMHYENWNYFKICKTINKR